MRYTYDSDRETRHHVGYNRVGEGANHCRASTARCAIPCAGVTTVAVCNAKVTVEISTGNLLVAGTVIRGNANHKFIQVIIQFANFLGAEFTAQSVAEVTDEHVPFHFVDTLI